MYSSNHTTVTECMNYLTYPLFVSCGLLAVNKELTGHNIHGPIKGCLRWYFNLRHSYLQLVSKCKFEHLRRLLCLSTRVPRWTIGHRGLGVVLDHTGDNSQQPCYPIVLGIFPDIDALPSFLRNKPHEWSKIYFRRKSQ